MYIYTLAAGRTYVLNGPGRLVKKITFKKGIDFCGKNHYNYKCKEGIEMTTIDFQIKLLEIELELYPQNWIAKEEIKRLKEYKEKHKKDIDTN